MYVWKGFNDNEDVMHKKKATKNDKTDCPLSAT